MSWLGKPPDPMENSPEFARVGVLLGPADLATVDALIVTGVVASRAEALRWAVGRIREHPAGELLAGEVRAAAEDELLDLAGRGLRQLVDERVRRLAPPLARHPDDRDLRHGRVPEQRASRAHHVMKQVKYVQ
jgi:hypothetical protein